MWNTNTIDFYSMQREHIHPIDFDNSEIAFRDKSNTDLRRAHLLFNVMNSQSMVNMGKSLLNFAFAIHFPVKGILRQTIYKQFVGGTSIEDCEKTIQKLGQSNIGSILDYALEGEEKDEIFDATCQEVIRTVEYAQKHAQVPFSAFKITGVGRFDLLVKVSDNQSLSDEEATEYERVVNRVDAIFKRGYELGVPILIDAEHSWIQPMLDELVLGMMRKYNHGKAIVQNTYQMYRWDSIERLKQHHKIALDEGLKFGLKIVRGAYMEIERERAAKMGYPSPIQPDKAATDRDYNEIIRYLVSNVETIEFMVATHNDKSSQLLAQLIDEHQLAHNHPHIYFAQLYGMSDNITYNLANLGYNVVKYVPYGEVKMMMPYLFRRAEENTSVKGQSSRELLLIKNEIKRRKYIIRNAK